MQAPRRGEGIGGFCGRGQNGSSHEIVPRAHRMLHASDPDLRAWLALLSAPGIGRRRATALLQRFGGPREVFQASDDEWSQGLDAAQRSALRQAWRTSDRALDAVGRWLARSPAHSVVSIADADYPPALLHSPDPPLLLYAAGCLGCCRDMGVAVVGSRHATPSGLSTARALSEGVSRRGLSVVSGLALGIDAAAHEGGLAGMGGTVAVIGSGLDEVYPKRHQRLAERIIEQGALISEYPLGTPALKEHFPQRNRIIAGLARAVIVVEAAERSGSLITARLAAEAGRDVFAVPGPIQSPGSAGCHALIKQGAALLDSLDDLWTVWEAYPGSIAAQSARSVPSGRSKPPSDKSTSPVRHRDEAPEGSLSPWLESPPQHQSAGAAADPRPVSDAWVTLRKALAGGPLTLDDLLRFDPRPVSAWQSVLLDAELSGMVARLSGGRYQWTA